jgi:hypothetical protein
MKTLKRVALVVLGLLVLLALIGLTLPRSYRVERSVLIQAKPTAIFPHVNELKRWPDWTAWNQARYTDMRVNFEGPDTGVGAVYKWEGDSSGIGSLRITKSDPAQGVWYDLDFDNGKHLSQGSILFEAEGDATRVVWSNDGDLGLNPVNRWFGLLMDKMMGPDFATGLENLKRRAETETETDSITTAR